MVAVCVCRQFCCPHVHRCSPAAEKMSLSLLDFRRPITNTYFSKYSSRLLISRPPSVPAITGRHRAMDARLPAENNNYNNNNRNYTAPYGRSFRGAGAVQWKLKWIKSFKSRYVTTVWIMTWAQCLPNINVQRVERRHWRFAPHGPSVSLHDRCFGAFHIQSCTQRQWTISNTDFL